MKVMKKVILTGVGVICFLLLSMLLFVLHRTRDRHPDYQLDLLLPKEAVASVRVLRVGLAKAPITPTLPDTWSDVDKNARYEPERGDTYVDGNGNGRFDAIWLAGFDNKRAANGVHDDLWARAILWDDGVSVVTLVSLDAIGLFHDDVITIRQEVTKHHPEVDHVIITATHCHEVPDLMGLWGESHFRSGVNPDYLRHVQQQTVRAIGDALNNRQPALLKTAVIETVERDLIEDSRPPQCYDDAIRMMKVEQAESGAHLGLLINYGCHPETLGDENLLVTADYVHYWLKGIEQGIVYEGSEKRAGVGGLAIYAQGAIGGLMTSMGSATHDPWLDKTFDSDERSFEKARAQGYRLAAKVLDRVESGSWETVDNPQIGLRAKTFHFDLQNKLFALGGVLGVLDRGFERLQRLRSEINLLTIGPTWFLTLPGEVNPEIVNGGIETPVGRDFEIQPVEIPPLRELMQGDINFVIGLANDEVGYIMPKTHWDTKPPYTYGRKRPMYGEVNSLGPDTGSTLHREVKALMAAWEQDSGR